MAGLFLDTDEATERLLIELTRQMPNRKNFQQLDSLISSSRLFKMDCEAGFLKGPKKS